MSPRNGFVGAIEGRAVCANVAPVGATAPPTPGRPPRIGYNRRPDAPVVADGPSIFDQ